jgi:hypothetical protein
MSYDMEQIWVCKGGICGMPSCLRCAPASEREAKRGAALRAVLSRTEGRTPPTKEPETGCGGPQEACIPCRKPRDHEAYRCTECGVTWCDECSCPAPTHDGGAR